MKAAWYERFGPAAEVLNVGERDDPRPDPGEVLVRMQASAVNPSDVKKRAGSFPDLLDEGYVIPHSDGAGVIEAVGEGVSSDRIGDAVWVYQAQYGRRFGTAAELVAIGTERAPPLPEGVSPEVGACLGIPVMTAHRCVFADGPVAGQTILITGGAGRVGHYAIQWAHHAGARVITTASTFEDDQACMEAGADAIVSHREEDWSAKVLAANDGEPIDRVVEVEFGANLPEVLNVVRTGATIATYSSTQIPQPKIPFYRMMYQDLRIRLVIVYAMPEEAKQQAIADIDEASRAGRLQHRVAHVLGLDEVAKAHELIEKGGFRGCVVVRP
jgi:NADPH:quinone reductase-like Zn-dependent oxidoreductase